MEKTKHIYDVNVIGKNSAGGNISKPVDLLKGNH